MSKEMLVLSLSCPQCHARLTEGTRVRLAGHAGRTNQQGEVLLSAVFGGGRGDEADLVLETDLTLEKGDAIDFCCPRCEASLMLPVTCKVCGAALASLDIAGGGSVEFCSRRGCKAQALGGAGNIDEMISLVNRMFDTPYD
ncbi:MAG: hypothetical protein DIJKHBIC_00132 [Thermoanaerobaculia bacterium]|nr:hypothetical protein [Thermoanaerobaculia bacterium]